LFATPIPGTTAPSDSRCATLDFAVGLYETSCPDKGRADGPLVFRAPPSTRAAPHTPEEPDALSAPELGATDVAFAVT